MEAVLSTRKPHCEDAWGARAGFAWVIDGASPLTGGPEANRSVSRFAGALSEALSDLLGRPGAAEQALADPAELVERARSRALEDWRADLGPEHEVPTACLVLLGAGPQELVAYALGDSRLDLLADGALLQVADPQFAEGDDRALAPVRERLAAGDTHVQAYAAVQEHLLGARRRRNTPEGLWILGEDPRAAAHGHVRRIPRAGVTHALLTTDGLGRYDAEFAAQVPDGLLEHAIAHGLESALARVREIERADPDRERFLRFTAHDDATGVLLALDALAAGGSGPVHAPGAR